MEMPEISMITDFEAAGMKCLQTPSLISRAFSLSNVTTQLVYTFWKWGAIFLAIFATFTSIVRRIKVIHIRRIKSSSESLLQHLDIDLDLSDDEVDTNDSPRVSSDSEEDDEICTTSLFDQVVGGDYEDFCVKGSRYLHFPRRRNRSEGFGWGDFTTGKNVVKLWDSLGLSVGFDSFDDSSDSDGVVSLWDFDKEKKIRDAYGGLRYSPAVSLAAAPSRAVVLSAKMNDKSNGVVLSAYDRRMGRSKTPALYAEWSRPTSSAAKAVGVKSGGVEKVYVGDDVGGVLTVGDVRKVKTPLEDVTETDGDIWWDADAVILEDSLVDSSK